MRMKCNEKKDGIMLVANGGQLIDHIHFFLEIMR
jgi:hypothetical protein